MLFNQYIIISELFNAKAFLVEDTVILFNPYINLRGLFNAKAILVEEQ